MYDFTFWENANLSVLGVFAVLWIFVLGAIFGSFLNVVVYRLPRGMPLAASMSRCPKCANPIAFRDNVPILSWIRLRGRCRSCGQAISVRYPLVEATAGGLFLLLFFVELLSGGANLPGRETNRSGLTELISTTPWNLVGTYAYHCCLTYLLLGIALMEFDRRDVPLRFLAVAILIGIAGGAFHPVILVDLDSMANIPLKRAFQFLFPSIAGLACGVCLAIIYRAICRRRLDDSLFQQRESAEAALIVTGVFLGSQAVIAVAGAALLLRVLAAGLQLIWSAMDRLPPSAYVAVAAMLQILIWRLSPNIHTIVVLAVFAVAGIVTTIAVVKARKPLRDDRPYERSE